MSFKHPKECSPYCVAVLSQPIALFLAKLPLLHLMLAIAPALTFGCKNTIPGPDGNAAPAPSTSPNPVTTLPPTGADKTVVDQEGDSLQKPNDELDGPLAFRVFDFGEPALTGTKSAARKIKLWATYYYIPKVVSSQSSSLRSSAFLYHSLLNI